MTDLKAVGDFLKASADHLVAIADPVGLTCLFAVPLIATVPVDKYPWWVGHVIGAAIVFLIFVFLYSLFHKNYLWFRDGVTDLIKQSPRSRVENDEGKETISLEERPKN